jgi:hypothetical protein
MLIPKPSLEVAARAARPVLASPRHHDWHLGKFLRQVPCLIPREQRRRSAPPIEISEGSTVCVLNDKFAGGFDYSPRCQKTRQHVCGVHLRLPSRVKQDMGALSMFSLSRLAVYCSNLREPARHSDRGRTIASGAGRPAASADYRTLILRSVCSKAAIATITMQPDGRTVACRFPRRLVVPPSKSTKSAPPRGRQVSLMHSQPQAGGLVQSLLAALGRQGGLIRRDRSALRFRRHLPQLQLRQV